MNDYVELQRVVRIVFRRWWLLVLLMILGGALGYALGRVQPSVYQATTTLLVGQLMESTSLNKDDVQMSVGFAQTYSDIATRYPVLQGVVDELGLNESWQNLRERVRVTFVEGTQLVVIRVEDASPQRAQAIAAEMANQLILLSPTAVKELGDISVPDFVLQQMEHTQEEILVMQTRLTEIDAALQGRPAQAEVEALQTEKTRLERVLADQVRNFVDLSNLAVEEGEPNSLSIIEPAQPGENPIRPRPRIYILLGGGLGLALALVILFVWEYLDDRVRAPDDLARLSEAPLLSPLPRIAGRSAADRLVTRLEPFSRPMEALRMIRSKLLFSAAGPPLKSVVVVSPEAGEGKTITAANLAISLAQANFRTLLVDADFRAPQLHRIFQVDNDSGLGDLLLSQNVAWEIRDSQPAAIETALKPTGINNLQVLTSGKLLMNSSELLGSERMAAILDALEAMADRVIIDSPPALLAADAAILSTRADGVVLVVRAGQTQRTAIQQTLADLQAVHARVIGLIYNQAPGGKRFTAGLQLLRRRKAPARRAWAAPPPRADEAGDLRQAGMQVKENL